MVAGRDRVAIGGCLDGVPVRRVRDVVQRVLRGERRRVRVQVTFLGRRQMRRLNATYLKHDRVTDVIAFALPQPDGSVAGDVYVCRYAAATQARAWGESVRRELLRLVTHGVLHVLGWDHPAGPARLRSPMWRRQERYLAGIA